MKKPEMSDKKYYYLRRGKRVFNSTLFMEDNKKYKEWLDNQNNPKTK